MRNRIKSLQNSLEQERSLLLTLINNLPDYVYMKDRDSRFILTNKAQADLVGASDPRELIGRSDGDFVPRELADRYRADDLRVMESGIGVTNIEEPSQAAGGSRRIVLTTKVPTFDAAGVVTGLVGISRDITERKELEKKNQRLATLVESADDAIVGLDLNHTITVWNKGAEQLYGYTAEEMIGSSTSLLIPSDLDDEVRLMREQVMQGGQVTRYETVRLRKGGAKIMVAITLSAIRDAEGRIVGLASTARDITDRKRAEEELLREQVLTKTLLESLPGIFYVYSYPELRLVRWNKAHETLFGFSAEEVRGRSILEWHPPENREAVLKAIDAVMKEGQSTLEAPLLTKDGRLIPFFMTGLRIEIRDQTYVMGVGLDITERRRAEEGKAKLEGQLQQAQKMESVGRLAGGVAHDFNNMLGVILGHTEMALEQVDPAQPLHADLEEIRKAAERSAGLTRQLLAFARRQTVAPTVLDLNRTVEGMLTMLERLVGENVHIAWQPKVDLWPVMVDPSQIDQLLTNLCVNARDAIADVGTITIETGNGAIDMAYSADHAGFAAGEYVLLAVTDDGGGMDKETLSHVFEPFFTTKGMGQGTGLGLATVYGIVKQNNGFINVYSEPGRGTRFTIYLPRHSGKAEQARGMEAEGPSLRGHETILLVEDEPANLKLIGKILERQGYTVLSAGTPGEAIRLAREYAGEIHLLMTDVIMPEMNGRDLARILLSMFPRLKRLFASGYTANVIAHQGVLDDGVHFIQKPFSRKSLAAKVREALDSE
jgi:two-component system cell cycle sensor histidine kinase/response regulator CckA